MEFLSRNPDVVQVHSVFSHAVIAEVSASNAFPRVDTKSEIIIEKKLEIITGLRNKGPSSADPTILVSHLSGGRTDVRVDSVCKVLASALTLDSRDRDFIYIFAIITTVAR